MTQNNALVPTLASWGVLWMTAFLLFAPLTSPHAANLYAGAEAYMQGNFGRALREWRPLAERGHAVAQFQLGVMFEHGHGVSRDAVQAVEWYRKAAGRGDAHAQNNLGVAYANGRGVPQDVAQAVELFRKSAAQGLAIAQRNLGIMYFSGEGVRRNKIQALAWLIVAAGQGDMQAERGKQSIAESMTRRKRARAQRFARQYWEDYVAPFRN